LEIKPATFRLVAQCLNQLRHRVPHSVGSKWIKCEYEALVEWHGKEKAEISKINLPQGHLYTTKPTRTGGGLNQGLQLYWGIKCLLTVQHWMQWMHFLNFFVW
jgi:hypothetical protein